MTRSISSQPSAPPRWFCLYCWRFTADGQMYCSEYCNTKDGENREPLCDSTAA